MGIDSNAHSTLWASPENNVRGDAMELFVAENNLDILNQGVTPTFVNSRAETHIDISLAYKAKEYVSNWNVRLDYWFSDHRCIEFIITFGNFLPPTITKVEWKKFENSLELNEKLYRLWTPSIIDAEASALTKVISSTLANCTSTVPRSTKMLRWWNSDLEKQKCKILNLARKIRQRPSSSDNLKNDFEEAKSKYFKACRRARRTCWKSYCNNIDNPQKVALLNKVLKHERKNNIGLLKDTNGVFTNSIESSLDLLLKTHFPESESIQVKMNKTIVKKDIISFSQPPSSGRKLDVKFCSNDDLQYSFITENLVLKAVESFGENKAPSGDGVTPKALQIFIKNKIGLTRLTQLFRASIELSYCPQIWAEAKVIFLEKPNKVDKACVKSFRPISLMSYLLKSLEKLIYWQISDSVLKTNPIIKTQHGFRKNYSCDTALSDLVDQIESGILRNQLVLVANVDIASAFDSLTYESAIKAMRERKIPEKIIQWYKHFLESRTAYTVINDITRRVKVKRGTAQGGILSPLIWSLVFESFLKLFEKGPISVVGFADDASLVAKGISASVIRDIMNEALKEACD